MSGMRGYKEARGVVEGAGEGTARIFGIEGGEAFVQDDDIGPLEQRPGDVESALFTMGELPAHFADHLEEPPRHSLDELTQAELLT